MLKRGGRRAFKGRRRARRVRKALGLKRSKYPDAHSFKLQALETVISNGSSSIQTAGQVTIGTPSASANGVNLWDFGGYFNFYLAGTYQVSQLNTLFDRYKVNGIKVKVIPQQNFASTEGQASIPVIRMVHDYDDASAPSVGDVWARRGLERRLDKPFSLYFKPKVCNQVWTGPTQPLAKSAVTCPWLDMGNTGIPLYGLKFGIRNWQRTTTPNTMVLRFEITYYVTMKEQICINKPGNPEYTLPPADEDGEDVACENK